MFSVDPFLRRSWQIFDGMENIAAFAGVPVPPSIHLTCDIQQAASADIVVMAVPSFAIRESAAKLQGILRAGTLEVVNAGKGLEKGNL